MCVAILKTAKGVLTKEVLKACYEQNPDGAGFVVRYVEGGVNKFHLDKGYFNFDKFWKAYSHAAKGENEMLVHCRIATHGKKNEENSHPHEIDKDHFMVHNGVLGPFTEESSDRESDTRVFVRKILRPMFRFDPDAIMDDGFMRYCADGIGYGNKVIILRRDGAWRILNSFHGDWKDNKTLWFSNLHWQARTTDWQANVQAFRGRNYMQRRWGGDGYGEDCAAEEPTGEFKLVSPGVVEEVKPTSGVVFPIIPLNPPTEATTKCGKSIWQKQANGPGWSYAPVCCCPICPAPTLINLPAPTDGAGRAKEERLSDQFLLGEKTAMQAIPPMPNYQNYPEYMRGYQKVCSKVQHDNPGEFVQGCQMFRDGSHTDPNELTMAMSLGFFWAKYLGPDLVKPKEMN